MGKHLSTEQLQAYQAKGFVTPLDALPVTEALAYRAKLEALEAQRGALTADDKRKMHLYLAWVDEIVRHPTVLDAVEDVLGPDILLFTVTAWIKEPRTEAFISWHQDSTYFGLDPAEHVTAWVALSPSTLESGCVEVVPGSHLPGQLSHSQNKAANNMLQTGQKLEVGQDAEIETLVLQPGQFSLHHTHLVHNSRSNRSDDRRIGLGISYIPAHARCVAKERLSATLVRGTDRFGHFDLDPRPERDLDPDAVDRHRDAVAAWHRAREELIAAAHADPVGEAQDQ